MSRFQVTVPTAKRRFCILEKEQFNSPIAYVLCAKCYLKQVWCKLLTKRLIMESSAHPIFF